MLRKQRGITMIGWIFLLIPIALIGYAGIRLVPIYLTYSKVARAMEQLASESRGEDAAGMNILRAGLEKRLDIEGIEFPTIKEFVFRRDGQSWVVEVGYEDTAPYLSNISMLVAFRKTVRIGTAPAE